MHSITIRSIGLFSFVKLLTLIAFTIGIVLGLLCPIAAIFGANVTANVSGSTYEGWKAAIINVFWIPTLITPLGTIVSVVAYLPFRLALSALAGLRLSGTFDHSRVVSRD